MPPVLQITAAFIINSTPSTHRQSLQFASFLVHVSPFISKRIRISPTPYSFPFVPENRELSALSSVKYEHKKLGGHWTAAQPPRRGGYFSVRDSNTRNSETQGMRDTTGEQQRRKKRIDPSANWSLSSRGASSQPYPDKREHMNDLSRRSKIVPQIFREHFASIYRIARDRQREPENGGMAMLHIYFFNIFCNDCGCVYTVT